MLVRLMHAWTDPFGTDHGAGELVDIDAVTLAELEEQGVVEAMGDFVNPTGAPADQPDGGEAENLAVKPDEEVATPDDFVNPTSEPADGDDD